MEKKLLFISFLIVGIVIFFLNGGFGMQANDIDLILELNKNEFKIGDDFILDVRILNNSTGSIRILPWMGPYEYSWFKVTDKNGKEIKKGKKVIFELDPKFPYKDSYILLSSHSSYGLKFKGKIVEDKTKLGREQRKFSDNGISIDFEKGRILLQHFGEYYIEANFKNTEFIKKEAKEKYNFNDLWQGQIVSNKIKFTISE